MFKETSLFLKIGLFWPKIIIIKLFSKFVHEVFQKLYLVVAGIKKWVKKTTLDF